MRGLNLGGVQNNKKIYLQSVSHIVRLTYKLPLDSYPAGVYSVRKPFHMRIVIAEWQSHRTLGAYFFSEVGSELTYKRMQNKTVAALLFFYIYAPELQLLPISTAALLGIMLSLVVMFQYGKSIMAFVVENKGLMVLFTILLCFVLIRDTVSGQSITSNSVSVLTLRIVIEALLPAFFISRLLIKKSVTLEGLLKLLVWMGSTQILFAVLMFNPDFKSLIYTQVLRVNEDSILLNPVIFDARGYGLANNYLFQFAVVQGILVVLALMVYGGSGSRVYLLLSLLLLLTVIVNARIGLVPVFLYLLISLLFFIKFQIKAKKILFFVSILLSLFLFAEQDSRNEVLSKSFESVTRMLSFDKETDDNIDILISYHINLPEDAQHMLFGFGEMESELIERSDIGYIRYITYGGIVYSALIYLFFILIFKRMRSAAGLITKLRIMRVYRQIPWLLTLTFFIVHIKGDAFVVAELMKLLFIIFFFMCFKEQNYGRR